MLIEHNRKCYKRNTRLAEITFLVDLKYRSEFDDEFDDNLRAPIGGGGNRIIGGKPCSIGAIWLKPGPPTPRTGPWRPGAANAGAPGTGGITPTNNHISQWHFLEKKRLNIPRPAARPAPCAATALVGTRAMPTSCKWQEKIDRREWRVLTDFFWRWSFDGHWN